MRHFNSVLTLLLTLTVSQELFAQTNAVTVASPDGHIALKLTVKDHQLYYQVTRDKQAIIEPSAMGLVVNGKAIGAVNALGSVGKTMINETYAWRGVHSMAVNHCVDAVIPVKGDNPLNIEAEVFNDGVAFRYIMTADGNNEVNADNTAFTIPAGSTVWSQDDIKSYEGRYQRQAIEDVKEGQLAGPPLTIKLAGNNGYAAITEGGVTSFAGMSLKAAGNRVFVANLTGDTKTVSTIITPWRIIEIGKDLNTLVNCDIIANVSPTPDKQLFPDGFATDWIKPGKSVWSWLAGNGRVTFDNMKKYSKWAGELGIEYNLVDEGWAYWKDGDKDKWALLKELVDYSNEQHVKVWVWKAYPDRNNVEGLKNTKVRREFFEQCAKIGVVGLKIDFFDTESQEVLNFYQEALKDAAKLHLMLDFHGADKPTGQSRTWPNEMAREGIRGLENKNNWPSHNTTLPFTRYLVGHGDYTPISFRQNLIKGTTLSHQVATALVYTSPFLCLAVNPEELLTSPVKDMVVNMPTTWDETIVLPQSAIGELAVYARRKGTTWYLSAINGDAVKDINISLSFLGKGSYQTTVMEDDKNAPEKAVISNKNYSGNNKIKLSLQPGVVLQPDLLKPINSMKNRKIAVIFLLAIACMAFTAMQSQKINIVFVGDSITEAKALNDAPKAPPIMAGVYLNQLRFTGVHADNQGRSGYTTVNFLPPSKIYQKVVSAADGYYADQSAMLVFSIMLGTNDSAIKGPLGAPVSPDNYRANIKTITDSLLLRYPKCKVILNNPIWYSDSTHNGSTYLVEGRNRLQKYFPEIKALVKQYKNTNPGHVFLGDTNGYDYFKKNYLTDMRKETGPSGVFYLHPNEKGSAALGKLWAEAIAKILKRS